jgi:hypothetical protein
MTRNIAPTEGGPSGGRLEAKIGAYYMLAMLCESEARGLRLISVSCSTRSWIAARPFRPTAPWRHSGGFAAGPSSAALKEERSVQPAAIIADHHGISCYMRDSWLNTDKIIFCGTRPEPRHGHVTANRP